jgi:hypothetical protein
MLGRVWSAGASRGGDQITLTTQGSWNRLSYLEPMARRWQGPVEMALLLDTLGQLPELVRGFCPRLP